MPIPTDDGTIGTPPSANTAPAGVTWPARAVALAALAGSLWVSLGMGLKACPLCFYPRTFVMGFVGVLAVGLLAGARHRAVSSLLALPVAVAGFGIALFHVSLELGGKLECPAGLFGLGTAPQHSLAALALLLAAVVTGVVRGRDPEGRAVPASSAVLPGLLLGWGSVASAPPPPPVPTKAYGTPLDICRPPFRGD